MGSSEPNKAPVQLGFLVDTARCIGCFSCAMACKNQHHQPNPVFWRKLYDLKEMLHPYRNRVFFSLACNHCERPACLAACPVKAYKKRTTDGIVVHDQKVCIGCGNCIRSCPWQAPQYNPNLKKAEKCGLCRQRIDAGLQPACVQACPVQALRMINVKEHQEQKTPHPPPGFPAARQTNPSIRFKSARLPKIVEDTHHER